jgi:hypothetical protein
MSKQSKGKSSKKIAVPDNLIKEKAELKQLKNL